METVSRSSSCPKPQTVGVAEFDTERAAELETDCSNKLETSDPPKAFLSVNGSGSFAPKERSAGHENTLFLLCIVAMIEGADLQLLPATFRALEIDMNFSPMFLGQLSLSQALVQAMSAPFWGAMADRYCRKRLLVFSCCAWGTLTTCLSLTFSSGVMLLLRCINGFTLAALGPIAQSVVADVSEPDRRGTAYGYVSFALSIGMVCASILGTSMAEMRFAFGIRGWRVAFGIVACTSYAIAAILHFWMDEMPGNAADPLQSSLSASASPFAKFCNAVRMELQRASSLLRIHSFLAIVLQGIFGTVPWNAMAFMTMYLQYCGHAPGVAALVASAVLVGKALGSIIGGVAGDALARYSPAHGRPFLAQFSVLAGIPLVFALVTLAEHGVRAQVLTTTSFLLGLLASWCGTGANRPILAEIVEPNGRASIIAWLATIEGSSAALFGAPVVGFLSEHVFGYMKESALGAPGDTLALDVARKAQNKLALGSALLWGTIPTWLLCASFYTVLHWTYAADVQHAHQRYKLLKDESAIEGSDVETAALSRTSSKEQIELPTV